MHQMLYPKKRTSWNKGIKIDRTKYPNMGHHKPHTEETKQKMIKNHVGNTGNKFSDEIKKKMSLAQKKVVKKVGEKSNAWKGGKKRYLARETLKRDDYICQICFMRDEEIMQVDHILEKGIGGLDSLENLQTLCPNCHARKTIRFLKSKTRKATYTPI